MNIKMNEHLKLDHERIEKITNIIMSYLRDEISHSQAKKKINDSFDKITVQEFALTEQHIGRYEIDDFVLTERIEEVISIVEDVLVTNSLDLNEGHPIDTYLKEVEAIRSVLGEIEDMKNEKFIKNRWLEIYDKLSEIKTHFARKQNQLYPAFERKGFDKPTKIMWSLDDDVESKIKTAVNYLNNDEDEKFLKLQDGVIDIVEDIMQKEEDILYPTAMDMISDAEFEEMRRGDDEIGYALIDNPKSYGSLEQEKEASVDKDLLDDLKDLLVKHGSLENIEKDAVLDVDRGKLTLEQINLIFKHMKIDLSYVDENEIMRFYTDTDHRVFPRSPGVIGRDVHNCHPKESVHMVDKIIQAFRNGEQDEAEFWIDMGEKFIYIAFTAVRDESGKFRGVLEMMQDVTRIRSLEGSQRLISWESDKDKAKDKETEPNKYNIKADTILGDLVKKYPYIKDYLMTISPKYEVLKNPMVFKTMSKVASMDMISKKGNLEVDELISKIVEKIDQEN